MTRHDSASPRLVLASASPRRADLLRAAAFEFEVLVADVDERVYAGEAPEAYVRRLAEEKALAVQRHRRHAAVLAADTSVVVDGRILGKPRDHAEARDMLARLSGRTHQVITGVSLVGPLDASMDTRVDSTLVAFAALTPEEIDWYVASGEPMDKAGAYAIQGLASRFIVHIEGSYSNVVGLPVELVHRMLKERRLRV